MTTVNRSELVGALRAISVAAGGLKSLPVLSNVAIEVEGDNLQLTGTNLDTYVRRLVPFTGDPIEPLTVNAKAFGDFAQGFSGEKVTLKVDDKKLRVTSGKQRATLGTIKIDEFPAWPSMEGAASFTLTRDQFDAVVRRVSTFAASDIARPILTGVHVKGADGKVRFEAADNYRVGILTIEHDVTLEAIIPATTLQGVLKVVEGDDISVTIASNGVMFSGLRGVMKSRLIEGMYPNVDTIVPTTFKNTLLLDPDDLADAAKLAEIAAAVNIVKGELADDGLRLSSKDDDREFDTTLDVTVGAVEEGKITFALNARFLRAIAAAFDDSPQVEFGYNGALAPMSFSDPKDGSFQAVVMPVRAQ